MIETTLVYLRKDNKVLLGTKLRGFGMGKIVGVGGKFETNETPEQCVERETFEETGVRLKKFHKIGTMAFDDLYYKDKADRNIMHIFVATEWEGEIKGCDELNLKWYTLEDLPKDKMWTDTQFYWNYLLKGEKFEGFVKYDKNYKVLDYSVIALPKNTIAHLKDSNVGVGKDINSSDFPTRKTSRAVMLNEKGQVCLMHAKNAGFYKLPGGGLEDTELFCEGLHREVQEESGYTCEIIKELGWIEETRSMQKMHVLTTTYLCRAKDFVGASPMEDEKEDGDEAYWADTIDEAIGLIESVDPDKFTTGRGSYARFWIARETAILRTAKDYLKTRHE